MVVDDFHVFGTGGGPDEAHTPLPIDTDTVLSRAVVLQGLQLVSRWRTQERQRMRGIELRQLADGHILDGAESLGITALEQRLRILAVKAPNHGCIVLRAT